MTFFSLCLSRLTPFVLVLLLLTGCGLTSLEDFREEGEGLTRSLIQEVRGIHTREELLARSGSLQQLFDKMVSLMIAAEEFSLSHLEQEKLPFSKTNYELNEQLRIQLNRLYSLDGGRQIIEKCQEKALNRLDVFEKRLAKQKENDRKALDLPSSLEAYRVPLKEGERGIKRD